MDPNSNFETHVINNVTRSYTTTANTNQLDSITTSDNSFNRSYHYNEAGETDTIEEAGNTLIQFIYAKGNGLPQTIGLPANSNNDSIGLTYGSDNNRVLKTASLSGETVSQRLYIYGLTGMPTLEIDNNDSIEQIKRYIYIPGATVIFYNNGYYLALTDHLGSTRTILDQQGDLIGQYNYDVYGAPTIIQAPDFLYDHLYTGQEYDAQTGLYNYKARLYDPVVGRFTMVDPAMQYFSPYVYTGNNPVMFIDPSGRMSDAAIGSIVIGSVLIVAAVGVSVATFGAATPLAAGLTVEAAGMIGTGALMGAGVSSTIYGAGHTTGNFKWDDYGTMVALGAAFGAVSAGVGLGVVSAGLSVTMSIGADVAVGASLGALDGYVTNGASTGTWAGEAAGESAGFGALLGGIVGGVGGGMRLYTRPTGMANDPFLDVKLATAIDNQGGAGSAKFRNIMALVPKGTKNKFTAGRGLKKGFKYKFRNNRGNWTVRGHEASPSTKLKGTENAAKGWTLEVEAPAAAQMGSQKQRLSQNGTFMDAGGNSGVEKLNEVHIPLKIFPWS
jgi:RHS repeat-associated protein